MLTRQSPVTELRGIGKAGEEALASVGIRTVGDLLYFFPRAYQNRGDVRSVSSASAGDTVSMLLTVGTAPRSVRLRGRMTITKFRAFDGTGSIEILYFNQPYIDKQIAVGEEYRFFGRVTETKGVLRLVSPVRERIAPDLPLADLVPVYRLPKGIRRKTLSDAVSAALDALLPRLEDPLPEEIRRRRSLPTLASALRGVHEPEDRETLRRSAGRLVFDEVLHQLLAIGLSSANRRTTGGIRFPDTDLSPLLALLPFELTGAQKRTLAEIRRDLGEGREGDFPPMNRIVVGDVGSGKTACAEGALYLALKNGYRAMMMAPTEILARQHYAEMRPLFEALGFRVALLCGSLKEKEKRLVYEGMVNDDPLIRVDLVVGTHALISERVACGRLGLIVTDEQHRFGVSQRSALAERGDRPPHTLVMSATPIPRTLSLALYGDLDVSRIDEMPAGRQKVATFAVDESYRDRLNAFIRKNAEEGGQVYIVCPAIEESQPEEEDGEEGAGVELGDLLFAAEEKPKLKTAAEYAKNLRENVFPDLPVGFLHGRMKSAEKDAAMADFVAGRTKILVSTTVIEVGVNVPAATLMIVENAERFGLSQLHQLRGRVGRGQRKSYCVLVSDAKGGPAAERLKTMTSTSDGYEIAERDLRLRGPGDFFCRAGGPIRQHGDTGLRLAAKWEDTATFTAAEEEAALLAGTDPGLRAPEHAALRASVLAFADVDPSKMN